MTEVSTANPGVKRFIGIDWDFGALRTAGPRYWSFMAILGIFLVLGLLGWYQLLRHGGEVLTMRDSSPWGLWFTNYMYYVGLSAGGLVVYASVHLFGAEQFRPLARLAVLQAGVLTLLALLGVITELERPWRTFWFLLTPNPSSPFIYTGSAVAIYTVICFVDLWVMITGKGGEKLAHRMTLIALPFAIYLHTTTAFVLALNKSRELWHTAVMVPIFLTSATASGIALLMIFAYVLKRTLDFKFKASMFRSLATLLATVIIIDIFLLVVEVITVFWGTSAVPGHTIRMSEFFTGRFALALLPVFILGIAAFALLAPRGTRGVPAVQITAAVFYVVAIYFKRYALMAMGFNFSLLDQQNPVYLPSLVEVLIALGLLALGLIIVTLAVKVLPMEEPEHEGAHVHAGAYDERAPESAPVATPAPVSGTVRAEPVAEGGVNG